VAERAVADVVQQRGRPDAFGLFARNVELRKRAVGEMVDAEAVFEARVVCRRVDELDCPQLFDMSKPLDGRSIEKGLGNALDGDMIVDAVFDRGHSGRFAAILKNCCCK